MKKNILMFFTDQLRFDAIGAHGNPYIRTPNIDRLIKRGTDFTNAYTPSPVCVAARCCLHYGQYPAHTGCWANSPMPDDDRLSYVKILSDEGYRTHSIGKCHFYPDTYGMHGYESREYQEEMGYSNLQKETYIQKLLENGYGYAIEPNGVRSEMYYIPQPSRLPQELHPSQWIADRSIEFLKNQSADKPWYLFSSFIHPHPPFAPPSPWHMLYRASDMPLPNLPENYEDLQILINRMQNRYKYRARGGMDINLLRTMKAYYYACVSFVDYQMGRILDTLEKSGQLDNTVIVFAADHGELLGDYNSFGKRSMHNAAARIPLIICGGDFEGGGVCDTPVSLIDIAPTLVNTVGADSSGAQFDGEDLLSVVRGKTERKGVYSFYSATGEVMSMCGRNILDPLCGKEEKLFACMDMMYVEKDFKYVYSAPDNRELLFDEINDRPETKNLAGNENYKRELGYMRSTLISYLHSENLDYLTDGPEFKPLINAVISDEPDVGLIRQDFRPPWFDFGIMKDYHN